MHLVEDPDDACQPLSALPCWPGAPGLGNRERSLALAVARWPCLPMDRLAPLFVPISSTKRRV